MERAEGRGKVRGMRRHLLLALPLLSLLEGCFPLLQAHRWRLCHWLGLRRRLWLSVKLSTHVCVSISVLRILLLPLKHGTHPRHAGPLDGIDVDALRGAARSVAFRSCRSLGLDGSIAGQVEWQILLP